MVDTALAEGRAALCGMIDLEIRQGLPPGEDHILQMLQATHRIPTKEADYALAGDLLASLRQRGITLISARVEYTASVIARR